MFPRAVLFAFCTVFALASVAQTLQDETGFSSNNSDPQVLNTPGLRSSAIGNARISITRLREPRKAQQLYYEAMEAWKKGRSAAAQRKLDEALKFYPGSRGFDFLRIYPRHISALGVGRTEAGAAIQTDPTYSPAYGVLAGVYDAQKRFEEAQQAVQLGLSAGADTCHVQYEIARSLVGRGDYEGALAPAEAALRSKPDGGLLHLAKVHALLGLRKYQQAATELNTFLLYDSSEDGSEQARELLQKIQRTGPQ